MSKYSISLLELKDCTLQSTPTELLILLKAWRKKHEFGSVCSKCKNPVPFGSKNYGLCCDQFYYDDRLTCYPVKSIAVPTPGYVFLLPLLKKMIKKNLIKTNQDFLVLPDPIYWQVPSTLIYEKALKFVSGIPMTRRNQRPASPSRTPTIYKQIQEAPLNYGSLESRACGKATFIRQVGFGKRCNNSMRGMIVPDPTLKPNEIRLPDRIVEKFKLRGKWVILNRMPSLQPENFVGLRVPEGSWPFDCFGIPLEILHSINGDFDGDEVNIYLLSGMLSQAECATILNPEWEMNSFVMGMKLHPCQDMLVAYYLFYDEIDFLPYKNRDLSKTFRVICDAFGSKAAFKAVDDMRKFYLYKFENEYCFALTLEEIEWLLHMYAVDGDVTRGRGCLATQVLSKAKGSFPHLQQMFGRLGQQGDTFVKNSFWSGLTQSEAIVHAKTSHEALWQTSKIWQPGYSHNKIMYNVQGLTVDYLARVIDGTSRVVENDVLNFVHYTDCMAKETFEYFLSPVQRKSTKCEKIKLFTEEECDDWIKYSRIQQCCNNPNFSYYLRQDRAMDEMPSLYKKCNSCGRINKQQ